MPRKIRLLLSEPAFAQDLYALLKAFWPEAEVMTRILHEEDGAMPEEEEDTADSFLVRYQKCGEKRRQVFVSWQSSGTEASGVQPADAVLQKEGVMEAWDDRLAAKNCVKGLLYQVLTEGTGRTLPWGDLTGIRPVKLIRDLLKECGDRASARRIIQETWFVSDEKTELALAVAEQEAAILTALRPADGYSLYIGIPFCPSICRYCSFGSHPLSVWHKAVVPYLNALKEELQMYALLMQGRRLDTVYIGGGTPTTLSTTQMEDLLQWLHERFPMSAAQEVTVEAGRPDTITSEMLAVLQRNGVTRISINPQTMNDATLERIGRRHTAADIKRVFSLAREAGFDNINMDLIVGLPGEGKTEVDRTLGEIYALAPDSLTVHSLALKRAARMRMAAVRTDAFQNSAAIMEGVAHCAAALRMRPYYLYRQKQIAGNFENIGYAKEGKEGRYNILMMEQEQIVLAAGIGASTKIPENGGKSVVRIENGKDLRRYLESRDGWLEKKRMELQQRFAENK